MAKSLTFRSTRGYRRYLDRVIRECAEGKRPMEDMVKAAAAVKAGVELFMVEHQLVKSGLDMEVAEHPDAQTAEEVADIESRAYVKKIVTYKHGVSPKGTPTSETTTKLEAGSGDIGLQMIQDLL